MTGASLEKMQQAMNQLCSQHKDILVMVNVKSMSYNDTAAALGLSVPEARLLLNEARAALQNILDMPVPRAVKNFLPPYQPGLVWTAPRAVSAA